MLGHWHSEEEEEEEEEDEEEKDKKKNKKKKDKRKKKKKNENKSGFPHRLRVGALRWEPADVGGVRRAPVTRTNRPATVGTVAREDMQRRRETRPAKKHVFLNSPYVCPEPVLVKRAPSPFLCKGLVVFIQKMVPKRAIFAPGVGVREQVQVPSGILEEARVLRRHDPACGNVSRFTTFPVLYLSRACLGKYSVL
jgi:hypothetical protein